MSHAFRAPLLSICVSTYNRARWLIHSLPMILQQAATFGDLVEVVVVDNTSTDNTPEVVARLSQQYAFRSVRNATNVGMLGNLGVSAEQARGEYVWVIGDDDLLVEGTIARVLAAIATHPNIELLYLNYAYTDFDKPEQLRDTAQVLLRGRAISPEVLDAYVEHIREIATKSENCFTAIYCLIYRRDHAQRVYHQDVSGPPFSSLLTSVPTADYTCRQLFDRPGYWIGDPCVVVNMNVSWLRYASLFVLENFPELFDLMQQYGADPIAVDRLRSKHVKSIVEWFEKIYVPPHRENLPHFSSARLVKRFGHLPEFQRHWPALRNFYERAFGRGQVEDPSLTPEQLEALLPHSRVASG